ncbi:MAG: FhaA domain-containing protein [Jatrophihabitans sp.]
MSLGQRFERRLEGLVGGAFARVFKGQVEPVEIGTALQREAADKRNVMGNGQVLSPNRYRVTLSPLDHERLIPWNDQLTTSLAELVQEHLDSNAWDTIGDIEVYLALDEELHTGVFGVASRMEPAAPPRRRPHDSLSMPIVAGAALGEYPEPPPGGYRSVGQPVGAGQAGSAPSAGAPPAPQPPFPFMPDQPAPGYGPGGYQQGDYQQGGYPPQPDYGQPDYGQPAGYVQNGYGQGGYPQNYANDQYRAEQPPPSPQPARRPAAMLIVDESNRRFDLRSGSNVIGRGSESDLQLLDQGISRRHVDIQYDGTYATAYDLGSTNGTTINGHEISSQMLRHGDVVRVGHTRIVFHQDRA